MALPPKRASTTAIIPSQNGLRVIAHSFASVSHFKSGVRSNGAWSDIIGRARLSRQQEKTCSRESAWGQKRTVFTAPIYDCFAPESGHVQRRNRCLLCANSRHYA